MKKVVVGIIGCGVISNTYLRDMKRLCTNELYIKAVSDAFIERAQETAAKFDIEKACTVEELLADPEIEIVVNLTPPALHTEINKKVLAAGKNLFCEKPFALSLEDAIEVNNMAKEKGLLLGSAPDSFMGSSLSTCRKLIKDNWIGRPMYVNANMISRGVETWHIRPEAFYSYGGGPVLDMGAYYFSTLVSMFGSVQSVYALSGRGYEERECYTKERMGEKIPVSVDTHYAVLVKLKNGMIANMNFSFDIWKSEMPLFEVYGTEGTLFVPDPNMHGGKPRVYRKEQTLAKCYDGVDTGDGQPFSMPELTQDVGTYVRYIGVLDMARALRGEKELTVNGDLAVHVIDILMSILKSAETGTEVKLTTEYDDLMI